MTRDLATKGDDGDGPGLGAGGVVSGGVLGDCSSSEAVLASGVPEGVVGGVVRPEARRRR